MSHPTVPSILVAGHPRLVAQSEALVSPVRNRYFYGKLLDEMHLEMEQDYFNGKRWLINRHGLGAGVMCGLSVILSPDKKRVTLDPGVALDGLGREIIVPQRTKPIDPRLLTDDCGKAAAKPLTGAVKVIVGVGYHECDAEPMPSLACECDDDGCRYGAVRERYAVIVEKGEAPGAGPVCDKLFVPAKKARPADTWRTRMLTIGGWFRECAGTTECPWVPLALLTVEADGTVSNVDLAVRVPVVSNVVLLNLILCLAAELDGCCGGRTPPPPVTHTLTLKKLEGASTVIAPGQLADHAPAVLVEVDGQPAGLGEETVTWTVGASGGLISDGGPEAASVAMTTDAQGIARLQTWRAPQARGAAQVTAAVAGATPPSVQFTAKVSGPPEATPPHIVGVWPAHGGRVRPSQMQNDPKVQAWFNGPFVELTFDQEMLPANLGVAANSAQAWLRVVQVVRPNTAAAVVAGFNQVESVFDPTATVAAGGRVTYRFLLRNFKPRSPGNTRAVLVLVRAVPNTITALTDGELLDADFDGKILAPAMDPQHLDTPYFDALWNADTFVANNTQQLVTSMAIKILARTAVPGLPALVQSGGPAVGGDFHSCFGIDID